jgi:phosphoribosylformylglycinamidine synthase
VIEELESEGRVVLRYVQGTNPNGSTDDIAGIANRERNVVGIMPHPERAVDPLLGSTEGLAMFVSAVQSTALTSGGAP